VFGQGSSCQLVLSPEIVAEILDVLSRPGLTHRFSYLAGMDMTVVLELLSQAEIVMVNTVATASRDPKDDKFLAAARTGQCAYIVTEDADLLVLDTYEGIKIVTAEAFLRLIESNG